MRALKSALYKSGPYWKTSYAARLISFDIVGMSFPYSSIHFSNLHLSIDRFIFTYEIMMLRLYAIMACLYMKKKMTLILT